MDGSEDVRFVDAEEDGHAAVFAAEIGERVSAFGRGEGGNVGDGAGQVDAGG